MEILYKSCKNNFSKEKQLKVENTIQSLKEIKERDLSNKVLKEIKNGQNKKFLIFYFTPTIQRKSEIFFELNKLIEISYNPRETVLNTWDDPNNNIRPMKILDDDELLKQLKDCDTSGNNSNRVIPIINIDDDYLYSSDSE